MHDQDCSTTEEGLPVLARPGKPRPPRIRGAARALLLALAALSGPGDVSRAEEAGTPEAAPAPRLDPEALEAVQRMAGRIAGAPRFGVKGEISWETLQPDAQLLEFGAERELVFERPDHLRVDVTLREGSRRRMLYDGTQLVLEDLDQNVYASVPRSGDADEVVAFAARTLGVPVALAEFLSPDLPALLREGVESATDVGVETVDGVRTRHVALQNRIGGIEFWIGEEDSLPRRITIRYEYDPGQPRFRARFTEWNLAPAIDAATFAFEPAPGAEKVAFARRPEQPSTEEAR